MWVLTTDGFYSVVAHNTLAGVLIVRARNKKDLRALFPVKRILHTPSADYPFRVLCPRREWMKLMVDAVRDVKYPNFKAEIFKHDLERAAVYARVWYELMGIEPIDARVVRARRKKTR